MRKLINKVKLVNYKIHKALLGPCNDIKSILFKLNQVRQFSIIKVDFASYFVYLIFIHQNKINNEIKL
jgi:hypothetical protein